MSESALTIAPIVLAAGESRRMGYPKALLPIGRQTFLTRILDAMVELCLEPPIVVLGFYAARIEPTLTGRRARVIVNSEAHLGQLSSIQLALRQLDERCDSCLLWPVDHPFVPATLVADLIRLFRKTRAPLVLPRCRGRRGHPAIIREDIAVEIGELPVETGAKPVIQRHENQIVTLDTEDSSVISDIDTPEDYALWTGQSLRAALASKID